MTILDFSHEHTSQAIVFIMMHVLLWITSGQQSQLESQDFVLVIPIDQQ